MEADANRDGSLQIRETLAVRFDGSWQGVRRQIPELANRPGGLEPLGLRLIAAEDGQGKPYRVETVSENGHQTWRIFVPDAQDATRTIVLRYRVRNGMRFYPDHDEINWNVTGNAWEMPIDLCARAGLSGPGAGGGTGTRLLPAVARDSAHLVGGPRLVRHHAGGLPGDQRPAAAS